MTQPSSYQPGPFDRKHLRITWGGTLPGNETWSCSLNMANMDAIPLNNGFIDELDTGGSALTSISDAIKAYHQDAGAKIAAAAKLVFVKVAKIELDGKYPADYNSSETVFAPVSGGGGNVAVPNQVALCVSLTTGITRGPAHRGRFYLPLPTAGVNPADGLITSADATSVAQSTKAMLEAVSDWPLIDLPGSPNVVVMSRKDGAPRTRQVTGVDVGRVLDTQRRRRRSLPETYVHNDVDFGAQ